MTVCRSIVTLLAVTLAPASALAFPGLHNAIGTPLPGGGHPWDAACGAPRSLPNGASQLTTCDPMVSSCLRRVTIPTGTYPNAVCNDGSPGVFYVRPGVGDDVDKWVIHTQGGGACRSHDDCMDRWCGRQGNLPYKANKMSSDWNHDGIIDLPRYADAGGMAANVTANEFASWTHVWMYYCSSDSWMGRDTTVDYAGAPSFTIAHRGHTILQAARAMLRPGTSSDDDTDLPALDDATTVLFTGTSAGAKGALQNADWFLGPLPAATKRLVLDANMDMTDEVLTDNDIWLDVPGGAALEYVLERIDMALDDWAVGGWYHSIDAFVDESCRADYEPLGQMDICTCMSNLLTKHDAMNDPLISTETFVRVDLQDPSNSDIFTEYWPGGEHLTVTSGGPLTTIATYTVLMRQTLKQLFNPPISNNVTGVFGPRCTQHVGLESSTFSQHTTPDSVRSPGGVWTSVGASRNLHDALVDWLAAPGPGQRSLDTGDVTGAPPVEFSSGVGCI